MRLNQYGEFFEPAQMVYVALILNVISK